MRIGDDLAAAVNWTTLLISISFVTFFICLYFSRPLLRKFSAWAEARAAGIDHQAVVDRNARVRLGLEDERQPLLIREHQRRGFAGDAD